MTSLQYTMPSSCSRANHWSLMKKYFSCVCMSVTCILLKYQLGLLPLLSCQILHQNKVLRTKMMFNFIWKLHTENALTCISRSSSQKGPVMTHLRCVSCPSGKGTAMTKLSTPLVWSTCRLSSHSRRLSVSASSPDIIKRTLAVVPAPLRRPVHTTSSYRYWSRGSLSSSAVVPAYSITHHYH